MPIFRVTASRTELFTIEAFVRAPTPDTAEEAFFAALEGERAALRWTEDYDGSDTEIETIEDVSLRHDPEPLGLPPACVLCGRPVRWTGVPAAHSPDGRTIPGPWVHVPDPMAEEGVGL